MPFEEILIQLETAEALLEYLCQCSRASLSVTSCRISSLSNWNNIQSLWSVIGEYYWDVWQEEAIAAEVRRSSLQGAFPTILEALEQGLLDSP